MGKVIILGGICERCGLIELARHSAAIAVRCGTVNDQWSFARVLLWGKSAVKEHNILQVLSSVEWLKISNT